MGLVYLHLGSKAWLYPGLWSHEYELRVLLESQSIHMGHCSSLEYFDPLTVIALHCYQLEELCTLR